MSDNTIIPPGAGGDTIRSIDRTTAKTQVVVLDVGGEAGPESLVLSIAKETGNLATLVTITTALQQLVEIGKAQSMLLRAINLQLTQATGCDIDPRDLTDDVLQ